MNDERQDHEARCVDVWGSDDGNMEGACVIRGRIMKQLGHVPVCVCVCGSMVSHTSCKVHVVASHTSCKRCCHMYVACATQPSYKWQTRHICYSCKICNNAIHRVRTHTCFAQAARHVNGHGKYNQR